MPKYLEDLENWMGLLPEKLRDLPIIYLAIPGAHNCMTYGITESSCIAPDAEKTVRRVYTVLPCIVRRWAVTQKDDIVEQLKSGVRFFDLRIVARADSTFYFSHSLYSFEITDPLEKIRAFLDEHPREFVILDCQHFYCFNEADHENLLHRLRSIFAPKIYGPNDGYLSNCTLNHSNKIGKQVVIIYRKSVPPDPHDMWQTIYWPTPWPNTTSITKLRTFLDNSLKSRQPGAGHVSQCLITPNPKYVSLRFYSSLKNVARTVDKRMAEWIQEQRPGPFTYGQKPTANVFLGDFVNVSDFCKMVIELNKYLEA